MIIRAISKRSSVSLFLRGSKLYHIPKLLQSKYEQDQVKLDKKLFHLYVDRLKNGIFNERYLANLALDCYRMSQPVEVYHQILAFALANLHRIQSKITVSVLLNQMYLYNIKDEDTAYKLAERGLDSKELEDGASIHAGLKLMILISQLLGLKRFPQGKYRSINFNKFRPLAMAMVLELLYEQGLQQKFTLTQQLINKFIDCEAFIPFADIHHLNYAARKITHPSFRQCITRIKSRIHSNMQTKQAPSTSNDWTSDQQILSHFRRAIQSKYVISE